MADAASLAVWLASDDAGDLNGRLISSSRDNWAELEAHIPDIMASEAWTLRRVGVARWKCLELRTALAQPTPKSDAQKALSTSCPLF